MRRSARAIGALQTSHSPEPKHGALPLPEGGVRVFRPVILVATDLLAAFISNLFHCGAIRRASVCDDDLRVAIPFHDFFKNFKAAVLSRFLVTTDSKTSPS